MRTLCYGGLVLWAMALSSVGQAQQQSALAQFPGFGHNPQEDEARFQREEIAREQIIARCMRSAGFEYTPVVSIRDTVDQNDSYISKLGEGRRADYFLALYGTRNPDSEEADSATSGGCRAIALDSIPGVYYARSLLAEQFIALRRDIAEDPRIVAANNAWSQCMWARGEQHPSLEAMLRARDDLALSADTASTQSAQARLSSMQAQWENATPTSRACSALPSLAAVRARVQEDYEARFVSSHREVLERFLNQLSSEPVPR